jgi:hypothetical protein
MCVCSRITVISLEKKNLSATLVAAYGIFFGWKRATHQCLPVAMSLRSWAFAGRKTFVAAVLGCLYIAFAGTEIWVVATDAQQRSYLCYSSNPFVSHIVGDSGTIYLYTKTLGCFRSKVKDDLEIAAKTSVCGWMFQP